MIVTPGILTNWPTCSPPRPFRPAMATRIVSLAPMTRPVDRVPPMANPAPAAASERFKNCRRFSEDFDMALVLPAEVVTSMLARRPGAGLGQQRLNNSAMIREARANSYEILKQHALPCTDQDRCVNRTRAGKSDSPSVTPSSGVRVPAVEVKPGPAFRSIARRSPGQSRLSGFLFLGLARLGLLLFALA